MADIVINGPEGQSTLNAPAWATEATQAVISKTLTGMGTSSTKIEALLRLMVKGYTETTKATKEGDKEVADLLDTIRKLDEKSVKEQKATKQATINQTKAVDDLEKLQKDSLNELGKLNQHQSQQAKDLEKILNDMNNGGDGLMSFAGGFGKAGNLLGGAIGIATKAVGVFGTAILGAATYITSQFTETFQFLNNGLKQGTGGIIGLTHPVENVAIAANLAGMSLEEFGEFAQANSKILRQLSARGFADLYSKTLIASGGLLDIGMTAEDAVESVMTELEYRRRFGMVLNQDTAVLRTSLMTSARELRIFANAVGMSEDELRSQTEIQEQHVDLMQINAQALGANTDELVQATQTISRQMGAVGLGDLINPLFEAISKGSTGLSDEFIEIGKTAPEIIKLIEDEAASFGMTGQLNANLGKDMVELFRNLSNEQENQIIALAKAGDAGAVAFNNLRKNVNRLSDESIGKVFSELDETSLSMLDTFNRLGFVVNQGTSAIGDMGKVAILSALGFDDLGDGTFDFNAGVKKMSENIMSFVENVFGYNSRITDAASQFTEYMDAMFGGKDPGESDEDYEARLDNARTMFVDTINKFARDLGNDLNKQIHEGTLFNSVRDFFKSFFEDLVVAINDATGGVLFDNAAHDIQAKRFLSGELTNQQFADYTGKLSGEERRAIGDNLFRKQVQEEGDRLGINQKLSHAAATNMFGGVDFDKDNSLRTTFMKDLRSNVAGFDNLSESEQRELFDTRVAEVKDFNKRINQYIAETEAAIHATGTETYSQPYTENAGVFNRLDTLAIYTDINENNMDVLSGLRNVDTSISAGANSMFNSDADARKVMDSITQQMIGGPSTGQADPGIFDQLAMTTNAGNANNNQTARSVQTMEEYKALRTMYKEAVSDGRMDYDERAQLLSAHSQLLEQKGFTDDAKRLLAEIESLIKTQKSLTRAIKEGSTAD